MARRATTRFAISIALLLAIAIASASTPAAAEPLVQRAVLQRARIDRAVDRVRATRHTTSRHLVQEIASVERSIRRVKAVAPGHVRSSGRRFHWILHLLGEQRAALRSHLRAATKRTTARALDLIQRRQEIDDWLAVWGVFRRCPVQSSSLIVNDNFGIIVRVPKAPVHRHMGNDITAPTGAPIVAPFDGTAVAEPSELGGLAVKVYGERGYVYNAHLSSYARLGAVRAGTVLGYVGSTGDATGPHDHFEWHPGNGPAVDPHSLLMVVC